MKRNGRRQTERRKNILPSSSLEFDEAYWRVCLWFFSYPDEALGLSDLAKNVSASKSTTSRVVERLVKEGFLHRAVLGRVWRLTCNMDHVYNRSKKVGFALERMVRDVVPPVLQLFPTARAIILFGSYRKGDDTQKSDIDIAVEVLGEEKSKIVELGSLGYFGYRKNIPVHVYVFSRKSVDRNVFANIANGIVLDGFLEVTP